MLRGTDGVLQSLHAFRHVADTELQEPYRLPVLPPGGYVQNNPADHCGPTSCSQAPRSFVV